MAKIIDERGDVRATSDLDRKVSVSSNEARQGGLGRPVLKVLIGGLVLVILAWGAVEIFGETRDNDAATSVEQVQPKASPPDVAPADQGVVNNTPPAGGSMQSAPADQDPTPQTGTGGSALQPAQ